MSYYPLLRAPGCQGWTTLCNFPPNNWEAPQSKDQYVNASWSVGGEWVSEHLGVLTAGSMRTYTEAELAGVAPADTLVLLSLTKTPLPRTSTFLPVLDSTRTTVPAWRATLGLSTVSAQASYQGEIDPFPTKASLLTFGPFLQAGQDVDNYLILLNIENSPVSKKASLEIYDAERRTLRAQVPVRNNAANIIPLDDLGFQAADLPLFICREMAAIPLYFSRTKDGAFLSLEHTHPPASLVVHGKRWEAQRALKDYWFNRATP